MKSKASTLLVLLGLALLSSLATAAPAVAQVFLALPEAFPELDARAVIMREPGRDILILNETDANAETLEFALQILKRSRRDRPRPADRGQLIPITGFVFRAPLDPERRQVLEAALAELAEQPVANVGNLGWGRWMLYRD